ncbi:MAG: hypothetical protein QME47_07835 [Candidatus Thermoplasmatota archaeon]|nr:hypothetical protein [Candidatus Thermoplasmatota archaeon]
MLKVGIKEGKIFCPGAGMIVDSKGCEHCRFRKSITPSYIECSFDEIKFGTEYIAKK